MCSRVLGESVLAIAVLSVCFSPTSANADKRRTPELVREFLSPSGNFLLRVIGTEAWLTPYASAELFRVDLKTSTCELIWRIDKLPHRLGPAMALVSNSGLVILIDEWVKTPSPVAITVLDQKGKTKAVYSFADIARLTKNSEAMMIEDAKVGVWQSAAAKLSQTQDRVEFSACRTVFYVELKTGQFEIGKAD